MMRSARPTVLDERSLAGATDFDAALDAYLAGGDSEALLRAAAMVLECDLPLTQRACRRNLEAHRRNIGRRPCGPSLVRDHG